VLHTGDWKLDPGPVVGPVADVDALRRVGSEGVLAMVCDSTNVFVPGASGSESALLASLTGIIGGCEGRVAVTCFSSNVARLETIAAAAAANGRNTGLAGRSLRRFDAAARENGYLASTPAFLAEDEVGFLPRDKALIICTGSQGDPRAALKRIADGGHAHVTLEEGDTVIFSARVIPGNEAAIARLQNRLTALGVRIVTERDHLVHVSGHPARDELVEMYQFARPRIAVPVHGELRHMVEHANLARECQVPEAVVAENGAMVRLGPGPAAIVERVPSGRLAADGKRLIKVDGEAMRGRKRALFNGVLVVTVVLDTDGRLAAPPRLTALGLLEEGETAEPVIAAVETAVKACAKKAPRDDDAVSEEVRIAARRVFREIYGKKPVTSVHLVRV
jgi:ribonuclease J